MYLKKYTYLCITIKIYFMTKIEITNLAKGLMSNYDELIGWSFSFNNRKSSFGVCSYRKKTIELSSYLVVGMTDKAIFETIIHEIAHALTPGHGHDYVWVRKCVELGGDGKRCGDYNKFDGGKKTQDEVYSKISKYTLTCPCCGNKSYLNRKPKRSYSCGNHGVGYNPKYKLTITQNY